MTDRPCDLCGQVQEAFLFNFALPYPLPFYICTACTGRPITDLMTVVQSRYEDHEVTR